MQINTVTDYLDQLPEDRRLIIEKLRSVISQNLQPGFEEITHYGMIGYVVPLTTYPDGYLNNPSIPLPYVSIASQKNYISVYHMGMVGDSKLAKWFAEEYSKRSSYKLDMGKSCIRFKTPDRIEYELIGESVSKFSPQEWISIYEHAKRKDK